MRREGAAVRLRDTAWLYVPSGLVHAFGSAPYLGVRGVKVGCLY